MLTGKRAALLAWFNSNRSPFPDTAIFSIGERRPHPKLNDSRGRHNQHKHAPADGSLPVLRSRRSRAEAHRAALAERGRGPCREHQDEYDGAKLHFTPSSIIRLASGKKKMVIRMRQATTEHMVSHFIRDTSY